MNESVCDIYSSKEIQIFIAINNISSFTYFISHFNSISIIPTEISAFPYSFNLCQQISTNRPISNSNSNNKMADAC